MTIGIEVRYNDDLEPLRRALAGVRRPEDFFVQGSCEAPMPPIVVRGAGLLSFPVPSVQIEAVVAQGERAPYGRGRETVLDTSTRKVWQLAPSQIDIGGVDISMPARLTTIFGTSSALPVSSRLFRPAYARHGRQVDLRRGAQETRT